MTRPPAEGLIRCPAVRSLVKTGALQHENLETASVEDLVHAISGQARNLRPDEPGSIGNVGGFFAIFNHGVPEHAILKGVHDAIDGAAVAAGKSTTRRFDLRLFESRGDHPGTVNFFKNDESGGRTRFVWIADLLPHELKPAIAAMIDDGLAAIKRHLESR